MSVKLNSYIVGIDRQAEEMFSRLIDQTAEHEGIPKKLRKENQMLWVYKINAIQEATMEIVISDLINT